LPICYSWPNGTLYPTGSLVAQYHQHYRLYARLNIEWVTRYCQVHRSTQVIGNTVLLCLGWVKGQTKHAYTVIEWFPNYSQQDATFLDLLISTDALHVSGRSSAHHQEHINVNTASGIVNQYCC